MYGVLGADARIPATMSHSNFDMNDFNSLLGDQGVKELPPLNGERLTSFIHMTCMSPVERWGRTTLTWCPVACSVCICQIVDQSRAIMWHGSPLMRELSIQEVGWWDDQKYATEPTLLSYLRQDIPKYLSHVHLRFRFSGHSGQCQTAPPTTSPLWAETLHQMQSALLCKMKRLPESSPGRTANQALRPLPHLLQWLY